MFAANLSGVLWFVWDATVIKKIAAQANPKNPRRKT